MKFVKILVVDDDPDILRLLKHNLELDGYRVHSASTGVEAFQLVLQWSPGIIILDLSLPDIDGIGVCHLIRQRSTAPIIMLSARDKLVDRILALEAGANDYILKPFEYSELAAKIEAYEIVR